MKTLIQPRAAIDKLEFEHPPSEDRSGKIRLDMNENTSGASAAAVRGLRRAINAKALATYPSYDTALTTLARHFGVEPDELLLTNGVDDAIKLICDTFVQPSDRLVIPPLTFPMYRFFHSIAGGAVGIVPYEEKLRLLPERVLAAINRRGEPRARWLALANPNNPTGTMLAKVGLKVILEGARDTLVLVDEAYFDYSGLTVLPWIRRYSNLVVTRTFSKAYGLASLRLGMIFAGRELANRMRRAQPVFPVNSLVLAAALEATRRPEEVRRHVEQVRHSRGLLCQCLSSLGVPYVPSAANFVFACFGRNAPRIAQELAAESILIRHWTGHPRLEPYFRIGIGTPSETRRLIRALGRLSRLIDPQDPRSAWSDLSG